MTREPAHPHGAASIILRIVRLRLLLLVLAALLALPARAGATILRAETVLPPGQSGFVSVPGLTDGTGSPHLADQLPLFVGFQRKDAMFDRPGTTEHPRTDVSIT